MKELIKQYVVLDEEDWRMNKEYTYERIYIL